MMNPDYKDDVLAITDEQIAGDWRLGLLRAMGRVVAGSALPADSASRWGVSTPGSNRAHLEYRGFGSTEDQCSIVEVRDIKEDSCDEWEHNSFDVGDNKRTNTELRALATCACGRLVNYPVSMTIPVGEFIYAVANAED